MRKARLILAHVLDFIDDRVINHRLYPWFCNICYEVWPDDSGPLSIVVGCSHTCWICDKLGWSA